MKLLRYLFLLLPLWAFTGCSDDKEPSTSMTLYDIVKLEWQDEKGSTFSLQKPDATEPVEYTANQLLDNELVPVGNRLLLAYVPESGKPYTSGRILIKGYLPITNLELTTGTAEEIAGWNATPVYLLSIWRSGGYINMRATLPFLEKARKFGLVLDTESPDPKRPDVYLYHNLGDETGTFDRTYYVSFDVHKIVDDTDIQGITLHINNSNLPTDTFVFNF